MFDTLLHCEGELSAVVIRADGRREDLGLLAGPKEPLAPHLLTKPMTFWERLWWNLKRQGQIPQKMTLGAFLAYEVGNHLGHNPLGLIGVAGLVTTAGAAYMAQDFAAAGGADITNFNYHDSGTGTLQGSTNSLGGATNATPIVITETAHGRTTNDIVQIAGVATNTAANGIWQITVLTANTYSLIGSTGNGVGTGGTAQRINGAADTALTTAAGPARVVGTQTNPVSGQYRSVATISYASSQSITEWGLFSASSAGTLWDRRWFNNQGAPATTATGALTSSPIGVNNGDSIQFTYTLTVSAGGS